MRLLVHWRDEGGIRLPVACWRPGPGYRMISSGVLGGGIGPREWVLNAQVPGRYARTDPAGHLTELAGRLGLTGPGTGMLTAARVTDLVTRSDEGAEAAVTAGLRVPTWAAAPAGAADPGLAQGTINIIVSVPVPLTDAALVNAVITATEAKTQAVLDAGFPGTGTATDAVCVAAPASPGDAAEDFAGPRSAWGARIARAVYAAVLAGATAHRAGMLPAIPHRRDDRAAGVGAHGDMRGVGTRHAGTTCGAWHWRVSYIWCCLQLVLRAIQARGGKREPGGNPGLPRSGERERQPSGPRNGARRDSTGLAGPGSDGQ